MRALNLLEQALVAGGLRMDDREAGDGGGAGGGAGGGTSGGSSSQYRNVLDNFAVNEDAGLSSVMQSQLNSLLHPSSGQGWRFYYKDTPTGAVTLADQREVDIPTAYQNDVQASLGQLAHELGHAMHPVDNDPMHYSTEQSYVAAQLLGEGYAQLNAIKISSEEQAHNVSMAIPGDAAHTAQELQAFATLTAQHATDAQIAAKLGDILKTQVLKNGQTYEQYYSEGYEKSHAPSSQGGGSAQAADGSYDDMSNPYSPNWVIDDPGFLTGYTSVGPPEWSYAQNEWWYAQS